MKRRHTRGVRIRPPRLIDGDGQRDLTRDDVLALVEAVVAQAVREVEDWRGEPLKRHDQATQHEVDPSGHTPYDCWRCRPNQ